MLCVSAQVASRWAISRLLGDDDPMTSAAGYLYSTVQYSTCTVHTYYTCIEMGEAAVLYGKIVILHHGVFCVTVKLCRYPMKTKDKKL